MPRIGIFDSGVGGLTVQRAIIERLPSLDTVYLGDTARVPYGTKSPEVVTRYSLRNARFLTAQGVDLLVVACNTASAVALPALREALAIPVIGVVEPGARAAARASRSGRIGVIGTRSTISSGAYQRALGALRPEAVGKQLKLADARAARFAVVIGPDDRARGEVQLRDLQGKTQRAVAASELSAVLRSALDAIPEH